MTHLQTWLLPINNRFRLRVTKAREHNVEKLMAKVAAILGWDLQRPKHKMVDCVHRKVENLGHKWPRGCVYHCSVGLIENILCILKPRCAAIYILYMCVYVFGWAEKVLSDQFCTVKPHSAELESPFFLSLSLFLCCVVLSGCLSQPNYSQALVTQKHSAFDTLLCMKFVFIVFLAVVTVIHSTWNKRSATQTATWQKPGRMHVSL